MHALRRRVRAGRTVSVASAVLGVLAVALLLGGPSGTSSGSAADRYQAGQPAIIRSLLPPSDEQRARARALGLARALGIPLGRAARVEHIVDRFAGTAVDEVVTSDVRARRLGIVRIRPDGRLAMAVRLGWHDAGGPTIDAAHAAAAARTLAAAAGVATTGEPVVRPGTDGGWRVAWPRLAAGIPVAGDGSEVTLFADGTLHGVATRERALATAPATVIDRAAAETIAGRRLATLLGRSSSAADLVGIHLAWVAPNDTFAPGAPDAPDPVLRLAWVAEVRASAPLADTLRALELYLDAGSGALLGGDLLR